MFGNRKMLANLTAVTGLLALVACQSSSSTPDENQVEATLATTTPVELDTHEPDSVKPTDVIKRSKQHVRRTGEIYLMRGLANVFSRGIDDMARRLRQDGYDASNFSYSQWQPIAQDIVNRAKRKKVSYPVIIVGHSLGANESSKFANYLTANGVNVELIVAFDPVERGVVRRGIKRVVNYYLPRENDVRIGASTKSADNKIHPADGFDGKIENIDFSSDPTITHVNVDKYGPYQQATLSSIASVTGKLRKSGTRKKGGNSR